MSLLGFDALGATAPGEIPKVPATEPPAEQPATEKGPADEQPGH